MRRWSSIGALILRLTLLLPSLAQSNVTVEESDPALVYTPFKSTWDSFGNPQTRADGIVDENYFHGGGCLAVKLPGATVSLTFNGSYIAYYSDLMNNHGSMQITLDGKTTTLNTFNAAGGVPQVKLFESSVDPNTPNHIIVLTCLDTKNMGLDYFLYTAATPVTTTSTTAAASSTASSQSQSSVTSESLPTSVAASHTGTIVAGVLAALGWLLAILLGFLLLHAWHRDRDAKARTVAFPPISTTTQASSAPLSMYATEPLVLGPPPVSEHSPLSSNTLVSGKGAMTRGITSESTGSGSARSTSAPLPNTRMSTQGPPAYSDAR